jgi:hypothetical protein
LVDASAEEARLGALRDARRKARRAARGGGEIAADEA